MKEQTEIRRAKVGMNIAFGGLIAGGIVLLVICIASSEPMLGGAIGWGLGFGSAIYSAAGRAIQAAQQEV